MTDTTEAPTWSDINQDPVGAYMRAVGSQKGAGMTQIPEHMQTGLCAWILLGLEPGRFLVAVLENKLVQAFSRADDINGARLKDFARFLYMDAPQDCWGSPEKVKAWRGLYPRGGS